MKALGARATGRPGSWSNGIPAMRDALAAAGLDGGDGDRRRLRALLRQPRLAAAAGGRRCALADASFRFGPEFVAALPIAAADGTLEKRAAAAANAVRAKTGLLTRVTALSGYAELADGTRVAFSLIINGFRGSAERAMDAVDDFVAALTARLAPAAAAGRPPQPIRTVVGRGRGRRAGTFLRISVVTSRLPAHNGNTKTSPPTVPGSGARSEAKPSEGVVRRLRRRTGIQQDRRAAWAE